VPVKSANPLKRGTKISKLVLPDPSVRLPMQVSSGAHLSGIALPHNDTRCPLSLAVGGLNRVCTQLPPPDKFIFQEFCAFEKRFRRKHFVPLSSDTVLDHRKWLDSRPYPQAKKDSMWAEWEKFYGELTEKLLAFNAFAKDESYVKWALNRLICAPHDVAKIFFGPMIEAVEKQLYSSKWFIKKVPVVERPSFILAMKEKLGLLAHMSDSDFTSYECSFSKELKEGCELSFMSYMTEKVDSDGSWMTNFVKWVGTKTTLINKFFRITMDDVSRYSGESTTSAFNGYTNVVVHEFIAFKTNQKVEFCVEGDDCLAFWEKSPPEESWYEKLGFAVKLGLHTELETTSFCGQVFAVEDMRVLTDPRYVLAGIGWLPSRYTHAKQSVKLSLLRAKAWSCGYQYQGCPILASLARYLLRVTRSHDARKAFEHLDLYKADMLREAMSNFDPTLPDELQVPVGLASRLLVERLYGIPVAVQRQYEEIFDKATVLSELPNLLDNWPQPWSETWDLYVRTSVNDPWLVAHPPEIWHPLHPTEVALPIVPREKRWKSYIAARIKVVDFEPE